MKPPESFVPLTAAPAPPASREFHVAIINGAQQAAASGDGDGNAADLATGEPAAKKIGFQSLATPRSATLSGANGPEKKIAEPRVTVQRDGDRVTHLRVQCTCGQIMDLACIYEEPPAAK